VCRFEIVENIEALLAKVVCVLFSSEINDKGLT